MRKRIVFIDAGFSSGGGEHQCAQLMEMLIEKGYEVTCSTFYDIPDHYHISPKVKRVRLAQGKSTLRKILAIEWFVLTVRADILIAFSQRLSVLTLFPSLLRPKIKVISSERNFTIGKPDIFEKILFNTGIYRRADYIVPNNHSQGKYISEKMPCLAKKINVITNYTDGNTFIATPMPCNDIIKVGIFCRFEEQKNFHRFIEAMAFVKSKSSSLFHVDWYGNNTFSNPLQIDYFEYGKSLIDLLNLQEEITIHDATKDVANLIPSFDVMCLPSLHEGFSNSISEYICCGRPVLCSDVSDNSVMVHDGVNGYLFDPLNVDDMANAFIKYIDLPQSDRQQMGLESRKIAEQLFDRERFVNSYVKLIEDEK